MAEKAKSDAAKVTKNQTKKIFKDFQKDFHIILFIRFYLVLPSFT